MPNQTKPEYVWMVLSDKATALQEVIIKKHNASVIWVCLTMHLSYGNICYMTQKQIATETRMSQSHANRMLAYLMQIDVIRPYPLGAKQPRGYRLNPSLVISADNPDGDTAHALLQEWDKK